MMIVKPCLKFTKIYQSMVPQPPVSTFVGGTMRAKLRKLDGYVQQAAELVENWVKLTKMADPMIFRFFTAEQKIQNPRWKVFMMFFLHTWVLFESEMVKKPLVLSDCSQPWYVRCISLGCVQSPFVAANQLSPNVLKEIMYMEVKEAQQKEKACPGLWSVGDVYPLAFVSSWNPESAIKDSSIANLIDFSEMLTEQATLQ